MSPGKTLRAARLRHELTQAQLAEKVGTSPQNIGKLERDEIISPSRGLMTRISELLDIPFESLIFGGHAPPKLNEKSVILARQIQELPDKYLVEVYSILLKAKAESETEKEQEPEDEPISKRNPA
jgi:transcriptional regulator with XRE-family HTH domain